MNVLEEMRATRLTGRLVPFLGAGMSQKVCRDWNGMVEALEAAAGIALQGGEGGQACSDDLRLIRRAEKALEALNHGGRSTTDSLRDALLEGEPAAAPPQTTALASASWPLVMTTNYDDLFLAAVHQAAGHFHRRDDALDDHPRHQP